ncbi:MAG: NAD-dependent dihydropyrimidine dehydrogenase subunit PreA [bacterium]|nr:NAD-dependent dihydropyrimidine dehydrogenase subunit PreA [bacterium]
MSMKQPVDLSVEVCGIRFKNPFMLASSPVSNCGEMVGRAFDIGWSGAVFKTIGTDRTPIIHPSPRLNTYDYGTKKLVGLQNVEQISDRKMKDNLADISWLKKHWPDHVVVASIMGFSNQDWADLAKAATEAGADMLELNFSCPHMTVEGSGSSVGRSMGLLKQFTETVKANTHLPVFAKMTPNITDMNEPAMYAKEGGADGIAAINTFTAVTKVGLDDWVPKPNVFGKSMLSGYSGPSVKPIGLKFIAEMAKNKDLGLPISGMGGIETWMDALEYILMGSSTIQVCTGIIHYGYGLVHDLIEGLSDYMEMRGIERVSDLVGKSLPNLCNPEEIELQRQGVVEYDLDKCIGCGQCLVVCDDAGGQCLTWDHKTRRPHLIEEKCLSCMVCKFVCPVDELITYKEMPAGWVREDVAVMDPNS